MLAPVHRDPQIPSEGLRDLDVLAELVGRGHVLVLSGAGVSTQSGIPDYRDEEGAWKHQRPLQYRDFVAHDSIRRRYWARSFVGWPRLGAAQPNAAHHALAELERRGVTELLVTQNVDGLHQRAGSKNVVDLHGRLDRVRCLSCTETITREMLQQRLAELNPSWLERRAVSTPDGDAELGDVDTSEFRPLECGACGGLLKPDVVFFGEHVPPARVQQSMTALSEAQSLLVVGSSLMVFSGYRFPLAAQQRQIPVAVINRGRTRADAFATVKIEAEAGAALQQLLTTLGPPRVLDPPAASPRE